MPIPHRHLIGYVLLAVVTAAGCSSGSNAKPTRSKELRLDQIGLVDAIIVPASADVQKALDAEPRVGHYARLTKGRRVAGTKSGAARAALCALESSEGFAVQASEFGSDIGPALSGDLTGRATAYNVTGNFGFDNEVFMPVGATREQVDSVRAALTADPNVRAVRYIDQNDAYAIFTREFADQPDVVKGMKPADLPVSFRIALEPGVARASAAGTFDRLPGVDAVISRERTLAPIPTVASSDVEKFLAGPREAEVFLAVDASPAQADAVRAVLAADPAIASSRFIDHDEAYSIFKTDFADQPALVDDTKPSDLPASFRITVKAGLSARATLERYKKVAGVETIITAEDSATGLKEIFASACTKP